MEEDKLNNTQRDYDKDPIIIEDYNYIFEVLFLITAFIIILYLFFINPFDNTNEMSKRYFFIHAVFAVIIPGVVYYFQVKKSKRQIVLKEDEICFLEDSELLESIDICNIKSINRTFNDYYMKSQEVDGIEALLTFILLPIHFLILIGNKFFFHGFKNNLSSYRLFDAIIIFDNENKFINILPTTRNERLTIKNYFIDKLNIDIEQSEAFYKFNYGYKERKK